jgi:hypothetical protein
LVELNTGTYIHIDTNLDILQSAMAI